MDHRERIPCGFVGDVVEAADVVWATASSGLFVLIDERGWSLDRYESWLHDTWCRLLLGAPA